MAAVGSFGLTAPAEAVVSCTFDAGTGTLVLEREDALRISQAGGAFVITDAGTPVGCGGSVQLADTAAVLVTGTDADDESVTLDLGNGAYTGLGGNPIHFSFDLGAGRDDTVVLEGADAAADDVEVNGNVVELTANVINSSTVTLGDVERLSVNGNGGNDILHASGTTAGLTLDGGAGDDTLTGGDGNDTLLGRAGADTLSGGAGNDRLVGGPGDDTYDGGDGTDTADFSADVDAVSVNLLAGTADAAGDEEELTDIENLFGSPFDDTLIGDDLANVIDGADGDDTILGLTGRDDLDGSDGADTLRGGQDSDDVDGGNGDDTLYGDGSGDTLQGGSGADEIFGDSGDDTINGGDGADEIEGNGGRDTIRGDHGDDTVSAGNDDDTVSGGEGDDTLDGDGGSDTLTGGFGGDTLRGGESDDTLDGSAGDDTFDGGAGTDTVTYAASPSAVEASLTDGEALGWGSDSIGAVENLVGSAFGDNLTGDQFVNVLDGGAGDDTVDGAAGNDTMIGGAGTDTVSFESSRRGVTATLTSGTGDGNDAMSGFESLTGSPLADHLTGDMGANTLEGLAGDDTLDGSGGDDTLDGGAGIDTVTYAAAPNPVEVDLESGAADGMGSDELSDVEDVIGSTFDDVLTGNDAANSLLGGAGDDAIDGSGGNDNLDGGAGTDTVGFGSSPAGVTASLRSGTASGHGSDRLAGFENLAGSEFDDTLAGDAGNSVLDGGEGRDTVSYFASAAGVRVDLAADRATGDGTDLLPGIENVTGSAFRDVLRGDASANVLRGGADNDRLAGRAGGDREAGGAGNDVLDQGRRRNGSDHLSGGSGKDTVNYSKRKGAVKVTPGKGANDGQRGERDFVKGNVERGRR